MFVLFVAKLPLAIVSYIDASKDNFLDVVLGYFLSIPKDILYSITTGDTTRHRNGTVSTLVVTTILNLEKSTGTVAYGVAPYIEISFVDVTGVNLPLVELG